MNKAWYIISNIAQVDSPALVIYKERVKENITRLVNSIDRVDRLRPHIKTHKSQEVTMMMLDAGIKKFKCATIAEAEMLADAGAPDILLAYQPVGPKIERLTALLNRYPNTVFACLADNFETAKYISAMGEESDRPINVFIDLNVGMNRTGIVAEEAGSLYEKIYSMPGLTVTGLHAYDGHLRDTDFDIRKKKCDEAFFKIEKLQQQIEHKSGQSLTIVAGGTPTFSIHCKRKNAECSPGTFIYWDKGYEEILHEQHYLHAALVVTRVISKPAPGTICLDLGHKAIASENAITKRVHFLNAPDLEPIGHSEEHMVFKAKNDQDFNVGDVLYGIPFHVCPTIALHDRAAVVEGNEVVTTWNTTSRTRKITI